MTPREGGEVDTFGNPGTEVRVTRRGAVARGAFTLIDVLVSIMVIGVLIGLILPSLASVNETARRVVCRSNIRQIGLCTAMYASESDGRLPVSVFLPENVAPPSPVWGNRSVEGQTHRMATLHLATNDLPDPSLNPWDGLGLLYEGAFITTPKIFYCPSHSGQNHFANQARLWLNGTLEVIGNYHYRGMGYSAAGEPTNLLDLIEPNAAIISDGMMTQADNNHRVGTNIFRADLSVAWRPDPGSRVSDMLPKDKDQTDSADRVNDVWQLYDEPATATPQ